MAKRQATPAPRSIRFSYSTADQPPLQRAVIQAIEKIGGQRRLKKLYAQHQKNLRNGESFFDSAISLLRIKVDYDEAALARTPSEGPVLFIANHPYGVLDGITLTWLATKVRPDTKVLANDVLCQAPEAAANLLTNGAIDPVGKIPEFKYCAVRVQAGGQLPEERGYPSSAAPLAAS